MWSTTRVDLVVGSVTFNRLNDKSRSQPLTLKVWVVDCSIAMKLRWLGFAFFVIADCAALKLRVVRRYGRTAQGEPVGSADSGEQQSQIFSCQGAVSTTRHHWACATTPEAAAWVWVCGPLRRSAWLWCQGFVCSSDSVSVAYQRPYGNWWLATGGGFLSPSDSVSVAH